MPSYYTHHRGQAAVQCPVCKEVYVGRGIWVHIIGRARVESLEVVRPHYVWLTTKAKRVPISKYAYKFNQLKIVHPNFYEWHRKNKFKRSHG